MAKEETGLATFYSVMAKIGHLLDDYQFGELTFKYLRPEKTGEVLPLVQSLELQPIELSEYTRMSSDSFHDFALETTKSVIGRPLLELELFCFDGPLLTSPLCSCQLREVAK